MTILGVTNSFTGPAQSLEIVGNHIYGYSGPVATGTGGGDTVLIDFQTGNYYTVANITIGSENGLSDDFIWSVKLAGTVVYAQYISATYTDPPTAATALELIIPAYTPIEILMTRDSGSNNVNWLVALTGRLYRE